MRRIERSQSSGSAKIPSATGSSGSPSYKIERIERPPQSARLRVTADHGKHDAEAGHGNAPERRAPGQRGDHRYAEDGAAEKLGRAHIEHDWPEHRYGQREQRRPEDAADDRRHVGGAQRAARLPFLRHGVPVEHSRLRSRRPRHTEKHRRDRIARRRDGAQSQQERKGGVGIHIVGEGEQQGHASDSPDARQNPDSETDRDSAEQISQPGGLGDGGKRLHSRLEHADISPHSGSSPCSGVFLLKEV